MNSAPRIYTMIFCFTPTLDKVLLLQKATPYWQAGLWNGPGGLVEDGETEVQGAVRELSEETEISLSITDLTEVLEFSCDCERGKLQDYGLHYISVFAAILPAANLLQAKGTDAEPVALMPVDGLTDYVPYVPHLLWMCTERLRQRYFRKGEGDDS